MSWFPRSFLADMREGEKVQVHGYELPCGMVLHPVTQGFWRVSDPVSGRTIDTGYGIAVALRKYRERRAGYGDQWESALAEARRKQPT